MPALPADSPSPDHLLDLLFAVDAAKSSVVLHVETSEGTAEFSISRGVLRGAAFGDVTGAFALHRVLDLGASSYQLHAVTEAPPAMGADGEEIDEGPRLSDLLSSRQRGQSGRSGFFMRDQLVRTPAPLPHDLSDLELRAAERLQLGAVPFDLVSELGAPPQEFVSALRSLVDRGVVAPESKRGPTSRPFAATLPSSVDDGNEEEGGFSAGMTLLGGSTPLPAISERPQPDEPLPQSQKKDLMASTQMAGSFASWELAEPATLRDQAPPAAVERARALAATISLASDQEQPPVPSRRFEAETLEELGGLNRAIHSSRKPAVAGERPEAAPEPSDPSLPVVGRYEVLARIKSGGMGSVYLCRHTGSSGFQRLYAMKVLRADHAADPALVREFFREARVLSSLHHPNVIGIIDAGSESEPYIVLDYVEGASLHELCGSPGDVRDPSVVVAILLDALAGTAAVHQATDDAGKPLHLVHHDLTPHNLLVGVDGACRVADFGVARAGAPKPGEKQYGKPGYVAPERYLGAPGDHLSDVFSLGVVMYTALSGVEPFQGATDEETRSNVLSGKVLPPSSVGFCPPPCLDWICQKALSPSPSARFQSAEEMMVQLRRIAAREELLASPSQVADWVRSSWGEKLERRRSILRPTQPPPAPEEAPNLPPFEVAPHSALPFSRPPSSYASREKTEALPSAPAVAPPPPEVDPPVVLPENSSPNIALYVVGAFVLAVLGLLLFAPDFVEGLLAPPDQAASPSDSGAPQVPAQRADSDTEVVIPEIRPAKD